MGALWLLAIIVKVMDSYDLDLKQKKRLHNAKFVTRLAKRRQEYIILNRGMMETEIRAFTTDQRSIQRALKTTKFIQSQPIVIIKDGYIPF